MEDLSWTKNQLIGSGISVPWETEQHTFYVDSDDDDGKASEAKVEIDDDPVLCARCRKIFLTEFEWGHTDKQTIVLNAVDSLNSCRLCDLLLDRFFKDAPHDLIGDQEFQSSQQVCYWIGVRDGHFHAAWNVCFGTASTSGTVLQPMLRLALQHRQALGQYDMPFYRKSLAASTRSVESIQQAETWLHKCVNKHKVCKTLAHSQRTLPKRLVHIDLSTPGQRPLLRLVESRRLSSDTQYMTLSHCWGSCMKSKLLRDNLPEYMTQIPFGTLPRVFQDAVQIVARFGMVYVWIDSLCIIQDSRRDWAAESAQMGLIYQNSFCNIAATGFADGTAGLFADRDASLLTPIPLELESDIYHVSEDAEGKARRQKEIEAGKYLLVDVDMFRNGVDNAPLNRRGWVVQERSLSPRTLHFGSNQLYWECAQKIACEVFPQGLSRGMPRVNAKRLGPLTPAPIEEVVTEEKMQEDRDTQEMINNMSKRELRRYPPSVRRWLKQRVTNPDGKPKLPTQRLMRKNIRGMTLVQHRWRDVVQNFSGCALTFSSDKLIAIAGLAQEAAEAMQCDYLTGLWRDDLEHQLLWRVTDARPKPKLTGCRGPSWSWASIDGPVTLSDWSGSGYQTKEGEIEWYTQVIEAATKAASGNIYGQIGSGSLKMTGRLGVLRIKKDDAPLPDPADENLVHIERQARIHWDTQDLEHQYCPSGDHVVWRYTTYTTPASTTQCVSRYLDVFVMPVRIMEEDPDGRDWEAPLLVGLLLLPTRKRKGQYRRVGLIEATQHWYGDNAVKPFTNTTKIRETAFFAAAGDAEGEYVVEIV